MKKFIILFWLSALTVVSCTKNENFNEIPVPVLMKVQAIDKDSSMIESQIIFIR